MTKSRMIVIWGSEDILSTSLEFLLAAKQGWKVVNLANREDLVALNLAVETTRPDIIILYQGCTNDLNNLPLQLLRDHPVIKVIRVSLEDNAMEVYSKQKITVQKASDLIAVIENGPYPLLEE